MIKAQTLLGGVVGIMLCAGIAYATIAPRMSGEDSVNDATTEAKYSVSEMEEYAEKQEEGIEENELKTEEDDVVDETIVLDAEEGVTPAAVPKATAPATQIAPTPTPTAKTYTLAEVAIHNTAASCWTTIGGKVYDLTSYIDRHPGGERNILKVCGKDGSELFDDKHGGDAKPESRLESLAIGILK